MSTEEIHPVVKNIIYEALRKGHDAVSAMEMYEGFLLDLVDNGVKRKGMLTAYAQSGFFINMKYPKTTPPIARYITPTGEHLGFIEIFTPYDNVRNKRQAEEYDHGTRWFTVMYDRIMYFGADEGNCLTIAEIKKTYTALKEVPPDDFIWTRNGYFFDPTESIFKQALGETNESQ
ncbi:hypothetical protein AVT69_gp297 [Pseudomonas phage PhiPA3]|uniref:Uncharacterized protein 299 n=1 Tax=Pseudomonas phage PhiPA3 TaxID=998086 RepID=F8SJD5_BPPA3|nr:hypothetical protein AVT69_gp297 [Pseudomonas phage PhiPA3]AEH03722.1 hypothetical protein [Pseudomonas phage PhiPA3]